MTDDLYYRKLENTSTTELVDMIREKDGRIEELEEKIEEMKRDVNEYFGYEYNILVAKLLNKWR